MPPCEVFIPFSRGIHYFITMKTNNLFRSIVLCLVLLCAFTYAQSVDEFDQKINQESVRLKQLEKQISNVRAEIKKYQQQEKSITRDMDNSQREISLTSEKIRIQNRELELRRAKKRQLQKDYQGAQSESERLIERYKRRVVHAYKLRPDRQFDLFVDAATPREFYYRIKYISAVNAADRKLYKELLDNIKFIDTRNAQIDRETKAIANKVIELEKEQKNLEALKSEKEKQYRAVSANKALIAEQIKEKENSIKEIQNVISRTQKDKKAYVIRLEEERKKREIVGLPFEQKKGKLLWPASGKIVSNFGKQTHPILGTITENSGIEIATSSNASVKAVSDGMVVTITWLRGFGNTIIVLHDSNYYTVYSHVENIEVVQDEYVDAGQKLATVSSNGSMDGTRLHFELWHEQVKLNPAYWLSK
jgi:septal ring factor EnvC (AmiA/AmiB activator)